VHGKGGKERIVPLGQEAAHTSPATSETRGRLATGAEDAFFLSARDRRLDTSTVRELGGTRRSRRRRFTATSTRSASAASTTARTAARRGSGWQGCEPRANWRWRRFICSSCARSAGLVGRKSWSPDPSQRTSGVTPGPGTRESIAPPVPGPPPAIGNEPVAEGPIWALRDEPVLPLPPCPVRRVEGVEVQHATVRRWDPDARRLEPVHRLVAVRQPPEDVVVPAAVRPVGPRVDPRDAARPVRDPQLVRTMPRLERRQPAVRLGALPLLERPVRAVRRRARGHEEGKGGSAVRTAHAAKVLPERAAEPSPAARVVHLECHLSPLRDGWRASTAPQTSVCLDPPRAWKVTSALPCASTCRRSPEVFLTTSSEALASSGSTTAKHAPTAASASALLAMG
jgi:hypothetical protein